MPKHHQTKAHPTNRLNTSDSIGPETFEQNQEQGGSAQLPLAAGSTPSYEDIQRRAYQIHEQKGGSDLENWLEAEQALKEDLA